MPRHTDCEKPNHKKVSHKGDLIRQFITQPQNMFEQLRFVTLIAGLGVMNQKKAKQRNSHHLIQHKPTPAQIKEIHEAWCVINTR